MESGNKNEFREVGGSLKDCESTDESSNVTPITTTSSSSEFAKRRSKFFNNFKIESLKLITTVSSSTKISSTQEVSLPVAY